MPGNYTSFHIQNTTETPILLAVTSPNGDVLTVGKLKPGKESIQVAPVGASWSIQRTDRASRESIGSPPQGSVITILTDQFRMETPQEPPVLVPNYAPSREYLEAILKLETGSHTARINQLLAVHGGKTLITSGEDKTIRIWDVQDKKQTGVLRGQIGDGKEGRIQAIAVTPDEKYLVALIWVYPERSDHRGREGEIRESDIRVFELATGNLQACHHYAGTLYDLDFSPDGTYLGLVCNPKNTEEFDSDRHGYACLYQSQEIMQGFDALPPAGENHMRPLYDTYSYNMVLPSYIRFVPQEKETSADVRLVVATWVYNPGMGGESEYTGRIYWYACSREGLKEIQSCETAKIRRKDPPGVHSIRPDSLAVSSEFVVTTTENADIKEFFCHNHRGRLVKRVLSETMPTGPVFSQDGSQLIVGQKGDGGLVQIKVYHTSGGQFQLRSTYYGHSAETRAVALLDDGTAFSAGGDQNAIHFWSPAHLEGEQTAGIRGVGRTVRAVGIDEQEQIAIGNHGHMLLEDGRIAFQRIFDLHSPTLRPFSLRDHYAAFQRAQTSREEKYLIFEIRDPYVNLYLEPSSEPLIHGDWYQPTTFGFTKQGTVITGADDGKVRVVAHERDGVHTVAYTPEGEPMDRTLVGHTARVLDHAASNKWLATCGKDQTIRLWYMEDVEQEELTDLEPALNLFVGMDDEWVLWSKSGYYTASQNGDRYLGYHINRGTDKEALFFPSDRFRTFFLRTDIIKAILMYGSEDRTYAADPQLFHRVIDVEKMLPPILELEEEGIKTYEEGKPTQGFVNFTLTATSYGNPIAHLRVLRNGRLVRLENSVPPSGKISIRRIPLLPGENHFRLFAETSEAIKSNSVEQTVMGRGRYAEEEVLENGMLYVLAIGVSQAINLKKPTSDTPEPNTELQFAHKDAIAISDAFFKENRAFPEGVEKWLLINEQATKENILRMVDHISKKIKSRVDERVMNANTPKRDALLVFLSGHGSYRPKNHQLYFWNYDFDFENMEKTALSFTELGEKITSLPAELILMTDACYSGMSGADVVKGYAADADSIDPSELAARIYGINESDMYILNAARRSELSYENSDQKHGRFAKAILDTVAAATDRAVTMMGLIDQVQWRVPKDIQHPVCRIYGDLLQLEIYKK